MARKKLAVLGLSGAPPLTKNFKLPAEACRILDRTNLVGGQMLKQEKAG